MCENTKSSPFLPPYPAMVFHSVSKELIFVIAVLTMFGLISLLTLLLNLPLLFIHYFFNAEPASSVSKWEDVWVNIVQSFHLSRQ